MEYQGKEVMPVIIKINGDIVSNDWKRAYDWFGLEATCPNDVIGQLEAIPAGDHPEIKINSVGGDVFAGQEIYTILRARDDVEIEIESIAASAASVIAMAGHSTISPVGMLMIHCVSSFAGGNRMEMEKVADTLGKWDEALATAYAEKTGKSKEDIIKLMEEETWLPADRAVEEGFIDSVSVQPERLTAAFGGMQVTPDMFAEYERAMKAKEDRESEKQKLLDSLATYGI